MNVPGDDHLRLLGLEPTAVTSVQLLSERHGHVLYRLTCTDRSYVLKVFNDPSATEVNAYALLSQLGVPLITVHAQAPNALLLEDLANSAGWRLATPDDLQDPDVGVAIACWYRQLHQAGSALFDGAETPPPFLHREVDALNAETIATIGTKLNLMSSPGWTLAIQRIDDLKRAIHAMPTTLTYGDFHWSNLAVSQNGSTEICAVLFDFHLLGIGMRYSDYRNVAPQLGDRARDAFTNEFGSIDEREALLDGPVSMLYALCEALKHPTLPGWAQGIIHDVKGGVFNARLRKALEIL